jgi:predicted dehydrogenase
MKTYAPNRRQFLQQAATAAGVAGVSLPGIYSARAADTPPPSDTITLGCIGVGGMGTGNMRVFANLPGCRVLAVCDVQEDRRRRAKSIVDDNYGNQDCRMYGDFRELLARDDIDALMIAPQDHWHALVVTAAVQAGKDMYCEKPLGVSVEEGQVIRDAVRGAKRVFQTGTWQRSQRKFQQAVELVRHGYLGKIHTVEVGSPCASYRPKYKGSLDPQPVPPGFDWEMWRGPAPAEPFNPGRVAYPDWYLIWDYCAGFITNWGVHHLDIAHWGCPQLGSEPFELEAQVVYRNEGFSNNSDTWTSEFRYASGLRLIYKDDSQLKTGTRFIGDEGWVHIDRAGIWAEPESLLKVKLAPDQAPITDSDHHQDNFLACVRNRRDPVSDVDAAYVATTLGLVTDIAGRVGQRLKWDWQRSQFVGNDQANALLHRPMHNGWKLG